MAARGSSLSGGKGSEAAPGPAEPPDYEAGVREELLGVAHLEGEAGVGRVAADHHVIGACLGRVEGARLGAAVLVGPAIVLRGGGRGAELHVEVGVACAARGLET